MPDDAFGLDSLSRVTTENESAEGPVPLSEPVGGVPPIVADERAVRAASDAIGAGSGPIAVDAERASGYRYGQRAYLIQIRRAGAGTHLIDPTGATDLNPLIESMASEEWILHAADQDLPCLAELGLKPGRIFDTELAAKILGKPRFGLGPLIENELGFSLAKEHSAADWSRRPLPQPWLRYAALDVELLIELRDVLSGQLRSRGREAWASEEFSFVLTRPTQRRADPWRRTSGINQARTPRQLALVRALWQGRDDFARELDRAPHRVLTDGAIMAAARLEPKNRKDLSEVAEFRGRGTRRHLDRWWKAIEQVGELSDSDLPPRAQQEAGPPPPRSWRNRHPAAAARLAAVREVLSEQAAELEIESATLVDPAAVRSVCWQPPADLTPELVAVALRAGGARNWQVELCAGAICFALREPD